MTNDELIAAARKLVVEYYNRVAGNLKISEENVCLDRIYETGYGTNVIVTVPDSVDDAYYMVSYNDHTNEVRTTIYRR